MLQTSPSSLLSAFGIGDFPFPPLSLARYTFILWNSFSEQKVERHAHLSDYRLVFLRPGSAGGLSDFPFVGFSRRNPIDQSVGVDSRSSLSLQNEYRSADQCRLIPLITSHENVCKLTCQLIPIVSLSGSYQASGRLIPIHSDMGGLETTLRAASFAFHSEVASVRTGS